jgi:hypothetical protein
MVLSYGGNNFFERPLFPKLVTKTIGLFLLQTAAEGVAGFLNQQRISSVATFFSDVHAFALFNNRRGANGVNSTGTLCRVIDATTLATEVSATANPSFLWVLSLD